MTGPTGGMPGILADGILVWVGLSVTTMVLLGAAFQFPTSAPASEDSIAETIDRVAASPYDTRATHPIDAAAIQLGPYRIAVRTDAGVTHAPLRYGPVTPIDSSNSLTRILHGAAPAQVFETKSAFATAIDRAQTRDPTWRGANGQLIIRRVSWGDFHVTLVSA